MRSCPRSMTSGPERRDESVQFSLQELMKLEDERVREEKTIALAREEAAAKARAEDDRREREALAAREKADADAREAARRAEVEEEARREALSRAAVEQARIEVEARTRAEESDRERRHELDLVRLRAENAPKPTAKTLLLGSFGGVVLAALVGLAGFLAVVKPNADRAVDEARARATSDASRAEDLARRLATETQRAEALARDLETANAKVTSLESRVPSKTPTSAPASSHTGGPTGGTGGAGVKKGNGGLADGPPCDDHDPMCFSIRRK